MGRYPLTEILLLELLHTIVFYPTRHRVCRVIIVAAMVYVATQIYLKLDLADTSITSAYSVGQRIGLHFGFTAYYLLSEGSFPDHWRRVRDEVNAKADGSDTRPSNFPLTKKFWWMLDLATSARMVGWVQEPKDCLPSPPSPSRRTFIWKTILKLIFNAVLLDLLTLMMAKNPAFDSSIHDPTDGPETYLAAIPLLRRAPYVLGLVLWLATALHLMHDIPALVCVGLGGSSPTLWPSVWGRWQDAFTIRKLWGRTWHQTMRPMLAGLGRLVSNKFFKFPRGTNRSSYTQLYVAFCLSAVIHFAGEFMYEKRIVYRSFKFFPLQAIAITFEDFIIFLSKRLLRLFGKQINPGRTDESWVEAVVRVIGYCWVILWFCLTLPIYIDEASVVGFYTIDRWPIAQFLFDTWKRWA